MEENRDPWLLDEPVYPFRSAASFVGVFMGFMMVCGILAEGLDGELILAYMVGTAVVMGILALLCRWLRKCRFRMDQAGIHIDRLNGKKLELCWQDIRTAAIVEYDGSKEIILSMHAADEVLDKERLRRRTANTSEEMQFFASKRNQQYIEHYLNHELPEIRL